jgi:hypothetical protein
VLHNDADGFISTSAMTARVPKHRRFNVILCRCLQLRLHGSGRGELVSRPIPNRRINPALGCAPAVIASCENQEMRS